MCASNRVGPFDFVDRQTSDPRSGFATVEKEPVGSLTPMLGDNQIVGSLTPMLGDKKVSDHVKSC
jgi:hypothetical protein